ncbi:MAG TPA: N,N-dimethylformamidase beta subunit family domain-containing protein [Gaiellales bacterium]|nr:N,N-dimethylformamidase beta subunit family domain-containing protein [Gaiellales bacterium]
MGRTGRLACLLALIAGLATAAGAGAAAATAQGCAAQANPIVCENALPGAPASDWQTGAGDTSIQGFATRIGLQRGDTLQLKIDTPATAYHAEIYRLGWYGGLGARLIDTVQPSVPLPQNQPACLSNAAVGLVDCGNWAVSLRWQVPASAVSGVYEAKLVRDDGVTAANRVMFVVRDDSGASDILAKTSDETWVAYNTYGGSDLYFGTTSAPNGRAYKVSYNRPLAHTYTAYDKRNSFFNAEYPMVRWLERNGYDVSYTTDVDVAEAPQQLLGHRVFISMGHDEYISGPERSAMSSARAAGVNLAFFSGNEVYWKTRWEPSIDASQTPDTTLVCYKESNAGRKIDPSPQWTGLWRDTRFSPPSDGGPPENELTGTMFGSDQASNSAIQVPAAYARLRFWRNTAVAALQPGQTLALAPGTLGWEWDEDQDNGWRPRGLMDMSSTTLTVHHRVGLAWLDGPATHHLTLYRASSGALVFGAGDIRWSWGLDATHDEATAQSRIDPSIQQATVNLLADMHVQPHTLQSTLRAATASTDTTPPTSSISSPVAGARIPHGTAVTISGHASDTGGVVASIEVSTDGGAHWHPAKGTSSWTYVWKPAVAGTPTILVRAGDDSGNVQPQPTARKVTVT